MELCEAPPAGERQKHGISLQGAERPEIKGSMVFFDAFLFRQRGEIAQIRFLFPPQAGRLFPGVTCAGAFQPVGRSAAGFQGALWFPARSWPRCEVLAEVHAAQRARAFQLSAFNPLCQLALMLQREI